MEDNGGGVGLKGMATGGGGRPENRRNSPAGSTLLSGSIIIVRGGVGYNTATYTVLDALILYFPRVILFFLLLLLQPSLL